MEYEVQYARITTTGKLPDRFLNCQSKQCTELSKAFMGTFYSLVEINSPWFTTSQVGQSIINTFYQSYYAGESTSDLDNFEEALKKVNENLTQITQNGETSWIGKLNAILAIQIENKILLAQTGKAEAYIFREGKINHLTYGLEQNPEGTHPSKTFTNITSGELRPHDKVLIANPDLVATVDMETLKDIICQLSPSEAVLQIAKILKKKNAKSVNVLILELMTLEEMSQMPATDVVDNIHLDKPINSFWSTLVKFWKNFLKPTCIFIGKILGILGGKALKASKTYVQKMKEKKKTEEVPEIDDQFHKEFMNKDMPDEGLLKDEKIEYSPELSVHYYEQEEKKKNDKFGKFINSIFGKTSRCFNWFKKVWQNKKNRPYVLVVLGVIVLIFVGYSIGGHKNKPTATKMTLLDSQNILKDAQNQQKMAKAAELANNNEQAKAGFASCLAKVQQITNVELLKSDINDTLTICQGELDRLTNTTRFDNLSPILTSNQDIKQVLAIGAQIVAFNSSEIYTSTTSGGKLAKMATLPRGNGDFQFGVTNNSDIYLYTSAQKVYDYNLDAAVLTQTKVASNWETANAGNFYAGNFYLLDGIMGQVYKHTLAQTTFSAGQGYLSANSNQLKNGISLAIDGTIYVLRSSGTVTKLTKIKAMDFPLQNIPTPNNKITKPIKIYTDSDATSIYILDGGAKRIVEVDKDGHFIHQYGLPSNFNNLTDFTVSPKSKKIWVLNQNSLYEIGI